MFSPSERGRGVYGELCITLVIYGLTLSIMMGKSSLDKLGQLRGSSSGSSSGYTGCPHKNAIH